MKSKKRFVKIPKVDQDCVLFIFECAIESKGNLMKMNIHRLILKKKWETKEERTHLPCMGL